VGHWVACILTQIRFFIATFTEESYTTMFFIIQIRLIGIGINISKVIYFHRFIRLNIYEIFLKHNM